MIELTGTIIIPRADYPRAEKPLQDHIMATRVEAGNIVFEVSQDAANPELFHVFEQFLDMDSFELHQKLGAEREWGKVSKDFVRDFEVAEL